jgi:hypothetical protein
MNETVRKPDGAIFELMPESAESLDLGLPDFAGLMARGAYCRAMG